MKRIACLLLAGLVLTTAMASGYKFRNIAGAATTVVKTGRGKLVGININKAVASGVITVYDNTAGSGTKIATITNPGTLTQSQFSFRYDVDITVGITVVTSAADDVTVIYE